MLNKCEQFDLIFFPFILFLLTTMVDNIKCKKCVPLQQDGITIFNCILLQLNSQVTFSKSCFLAHVSINAIKSEIKSIGEIYFK